MIRKRWLYRQSIPANSLPLFSFFFFFFTTRFVKVCLLHPSFVPFFLHVFFILLTIVTVNVVSPRTIIINITFYYNYVYNRNYNIIIVFIIIILLNCSIYFSQH